MTQEEIQNKLKDIKKSFRLVMDGVTAQSMRDKGLDYHINWGAAVPRLKAMAKEIDKDYGLSVALWKENIRECKILATLVMPVDMMESDMVDLWMEQTDSVEIAEMASLNLYQYLPFAAEKAYQWIASDKELYQLCGFHVLSRLFMNGQQPNERGINEFLDQWQVAVCGSSVMVRKAAVAALLRFAGLGLVYERMASTVSRRTGFDII
ncbi:DNA alkylation repair protein [Xylanibacter muris]|uniref:DNA alkylation repair protein n=1 Tax=Xylanibacter muris TaxID=2736290 RepID=A0ABX2APJ7_9BACT|nr:DNA alkylation repair protein [Xylanibacter muris]NPD93123.1 DNA alkylation repair protein [Xylanibacter muris]